MRPCCGHRGVQMLHLKQCELVYLDKGDDEGGTLVADLRDVRVHIPVPDTGHRVRVFLARAERDAQPTGTAGDGERCDLQPMGVGGAEGHGGCSTGA